MISNRKKDIKQKKTNKKHFSPFQLTINHFSQTLLSLITKISNNDSNNHKKIF